MGEIIIFAETVNDLSILAGSTDKLLNTGNNTGGMGGFNQHWPQQQHPYQQQSRSQTKRLKMTYHCKFGEFGVMEGKSPPGSWLTIIMRTLPGQFTEPSGVAVNAQNDIVVVSA